MTSETPDLLMISLSLSDGGVLEIKCILITCCCEFLVRSGFLSLVWHMHSVCLLHGHVAHSSHSAEELDSRFSSEWETLRLPLS